MSNIRLNTLRTHSKAAHNMALRFLAIPGRERDAYILSREAEKIDAEIARLEVSGIDPRLQNAIGPAYRVMDGVQVGGS
jgi:hypothetical protein